MSNSNLENPSIRNFHVYPVAFSNSILDFVGVLDECGVDYLVF